MILFQLRFPTGEWRFRVVAVEMQPHFDPVTATTPFILKLIDARQHPYACWLSPAQYADMQTRLDQAINQQTEYWVQLDAAQSDHPALQLLQAIRHDQIVEQPPTP